MKSSVGNVFIVIMSYNWLILEIFCILLLEFNVVDDEFNFNCSDVLNFINWFMNKCGRFLVYLYKSFCKCCCILFLW